MNLKIKINYLNFLRFDHCWMILVFQRNPFLSSSFYLVPSPAWGFRPGIRGGRFDLDIFAGAVSAIPWPLLTFVRDEGLGSGSLLFLLLRLGNLELPLFGRPLLRVSCLGALCEDLLLIADIDGPEDMIALPEFLKMPLSYAWSLAPD